MKNILSKLLISLTIVQIPLQAMEQNPVPQNSAIVFAKDVGNGLVHLGNNMSIPHLYCDLGIWRIPYTSLALFGANAAYQCGIYAYKCYNRSQIRKLESAEYMDERLNPRHTIVQEVLRSRASYGTANRPFPKEVIDIINDYDNTIQKDVAREKAILKEMNKKADNPQKSQFKKLHMVKRGTEATVGTINTFYSINNTLSYASWRIWLLGITIKAGASLFEKTQQHNTPAK